MFCVFHWWFSACTSISLLKVNHSLPSPCSWVYGASPKNWHFLVDVGVSSSRSTENFWEGAGTTCGIGHLAQCRHIASHAQRMACIRHLLQLLLRLRTLQGPLPLSHTALSTKMQPVSILQWDDGTSALLRHWCVL